MKYRREIDGLRAIAVVSVILFHAGVPWIGGGYFGVDIFFVISGYLITSIIWQEAEAGTFSFARFYERRARRILPALFVVLLASAVFAYLWMLPSDLKDFARSLISVALFVSNIYFYRFTDYFNSASDVKPLLHTWSLGVEEQFYILFPVLLIFSYRLGKGFGSVFLFLLACLSLSLAHWATGLYHLASFYLLPTRMWEFLSGSLLGILALKGGEERMATGVRHALSATGLVLVFLSMIVFDKNTANPGLATVVPVAGACLVIFSATREQFVGRLLGSRLLVGIGLISYSAYLWHQPVLAFLRIRSIEAPSQGAVFVALALTFFLAAITWKYVEQPMRNLTFLRRKHIFSGACAGIVCLSGLGVYGEHRKGFEERYSIPDYMSSEFAPGNVPIVCSLPDKCSIGDISGRDSKVVVFGDSHSSALLPAFESVGKDLRKHIAVSELEGCPPLQGVVVLKGNYDIGRCEEESRKQLDFVTKYRPKKIFLVARWSLYTDGGYDGSGMFYLGLDKTSPLDKGVSREAFRQGVLKTVEIYRKLGSEVYVVTQVPQQRVNVKEFYYSIFRDGVITQQAEHFIQKYSISQSEHSRLQHYNRAVFSELASTGAIQLIGLDELFCNELECNFGTLSHSYYRDMDHLSYFAAQRLAPKVRPYLY